jgi:hypothetical protein
MIANCQMALDTWRNTGLLTPL